MTRKDYIKFAEMFLRAKPAEEEYPKNSGILKWEQLVDRTADIFAADNDRFNYSKFFEACGRD